MRKTRIVALSLAVLMVGAACSDSSADGGGEDIEVPAAGEWTGDVEAFIPNAPGGGFDIAVRALQQPLAEELGTSVVPTNLEGAGGAIAAGEMLGQPADGTSMMIVSRSISAVPYTGSPELDPLEDFAALGVTHQDISALTVRSDAPYQTVEEFISFAEENPGEVVIGHSGVGGVWHAAALVLAREAGIEFSFATYDGGSAAGQALLSGEVDAVTIGAPETRPFVEGGEGTMLAVMGDERSDLYPDVPTLIEEGIDVTYSVWRGYVINAEVSEDLRMELSARIEAAANSDANQEAMTEAGFETTWIGPEEFDDLIAEEDQLVRDLFEGEDFMTTAPERVSE